MTSHQSSLPTIQPDSHSNPDTVVLPSHNNAPTEPHTTSSGTASDIGKNKPVSSETPKDPPLPTSSINDHTLTLVASSPARIWSIHRNAYLLDSTKTEAYREAQTKIYPWIALSAIAAFDNDSDMQQTTLYWLVDFITKVKSVSGVEPALLTLLYALRKSPNLKNVQAGLNVWNLYAKDGEAVQGSDDLFVYDVEKQRLITLSTLVMNKIRNGAFIDNLDTMPDELAKIAPFVDSNPFDRPQTTSPNLVEIHASPVDGTTGPISTHPDEQALEKAKHKYHLLVGKVVGGVLKGTGELVKKMVPKLATWAGEPALAAAAEAAAAELGTAEAALIFPIVAPAVVAAVVGSAAVIAEVGFWVGLAALVVDMVEQGSEIDKMALHIADADWLGSLPTLTLGAVNPGSLPSSTGTTGTAGGSVANTHGGVEGGFGGSGSLPTLTSPVNSPSESPNSTHPNIGSTGGPTAPGSGPLEGPSQGPHDPSTGPSHSPDGPQLPSDVPNIPNSSPNGPGSTPVDPDAPHQPGSTGTDPNSNPGVADPTHTPKGPLPPPEDPSGPVGSPPPTSPTPPPTPVPTTPIPTSNPTSKPPNQPVSPDEDPDKPKPLDPNTDPIASGPGGGGGGGNHLTLTAPTNSGGGDVPRGHDGLPVDNPTGPHPLGGH